MKPDQNKRVSLFQSQTDVREREFALDNDSDCKTPSKKKSGRIVLMVLLIIVAITVVTSCVLMTINAFNLRDIAMSWFNRQPIEESIPSVEETSEPLPIVIESEEVSEQESEPVSEESEEIRDHGWVINQMGYTYLYHGVGIEQFNFNEATIGKYLGQLSALEKAIKTSSRIYCMPIPTRIGYMQNEIPVEIRREDNFYNSSQKDFLDAVKASLPEKVKLLNLYDSFCNAYEQGSDPYFKSDKNWTSDAAYLAYLAYCEQRRFTPVELSSYQQKVTEGFLGSFYFATNDAIMAENSEKFVYYTNDYLNDCDNTVYQNGLTFKNYCLGDNKVGSIYDAYSVYLGTSKAHFKITTKAGTGNKLLIIGDQSAAAMIPFLANHFNEIHYYDISSGTESISKILKDCRFNDILLCTYMTNAVKGDLPDNLSRVLEINNNQENENNG